MSASRRYEILLPLQFNDGQPVPDSLIGEALTDLRGHFGAVAWETQIIKGTWEHQEQLYRDNLMRVIVDVPDTEDTRRFFSQFKQTLKTRFRQIDIWMTTHMIEII
jgi:hypothetical protein